MGNVLSCDTVPWEVWTKVYLPQIAIPWQTKVQLPPKSSLVSQLSLTDKVQMPPKSSLVSPWASLGLLTGIKVRGYRSSNDSKSTHLSMGDNSQKLKTWSTQYSLQNRLGVSFPARDVWVWHTLINSLQLWSPAEDLDKICTKLGQWVFPMDGGKGPWSRLPPRGTVGGLRALEEGSVFFDV